MFRFFFSILVAVYVVYRIVRAHIQERRNEKQWSKLR